MPTPVKLLLVFAGGAIGAVLRVLLLAVPVWPSGPLGESIGLACINVGGAFLLGWLLSESAAATSRSSTPRAEAARLLLGTGALGGFTSYSSLILLALPPGGAMPLGSVLACASLVLGIAAAALGMRLGRRGGPARASVLTSGGAR